MLFKVFEMASLSACPLLMINFDKVTLTNLFSLSLASITPSRYFLRIARPKTMPAPALILVVLATTPPATTRRRSAAAELATMPQMAPSQAATTKVFRAGNACSRATKSSVKTTWRDKGM